MVNNKCGRVKAATCCANCKYSQGSRCRLMECAIYPGAICEKYENDIKRTNRKLKNNEECNVSWSLSSYRYIKKQQDFLIEMGDVYPYLQKTVVAKLDGAHIIDKTTNKCETIDASTKLKVEGWFIMAVINGKDYNLVHLIDYTIFRKLERACAHYIYDCIKDELDEMDKESDI